ncbi:25784_t:CDS:2 [Gigaspora rosea]|nr:25784_t:CDS:2 [Gigaspora rosea]
MGHIHDRSPVVQTENVWVHDSTNNADWLCVCIKVDISQWRNFDEPIDVKTSMLSWRSLVLISVEDLSLGSNDNEGLDTKVFLFPDGYEANPIILHASKASKARGIARY